MSMKTYICWRVEWGRQLTRERQKGPVEAGDHGDDAGEEVRKAGSVLVLRECFLKTR